MGSAFASFSDEEFLVRYDHQRSISLVGESISRSFFSKVHFVFTHSEFSCFTLPTSQYLSRNFHCLELYLNWSNIGDSGCHDLASCLLSNMTLRFIDLSSNNISDTGLRLLADSLKRNSSSALEELVLENNECFAFSIVASFFFLLTCCSVTDSGASYLIESIQAHRSLLRVGLISNHCTPGSSLLSGLSLACVSLPCLCLGPLWSHCQSVSLACAWGRPSPCPPLAAKPQ